MTTQPQPDQDLLTVAKFAKCYGIYLERQAQEILTTACLSTVDARGAVFMFQDGLFGPEQVFEPSVLREVFCAYLNQH